MSARRRAATTAGFSASLMTALTGCAVTTEPSAALTDDKAVVAAAPPAREITMEIPKPRTAAPALRTTGVAWQPILESLTTYGQWVLANPHPNKVTDVAAPGCAFTQTLGRRVRGLLTSNAYQQPRPATFLTITGPAADTDDTTEEAGDEAVTIGNNVTVHVTASRPSAPVMNRTGIQITTVAALPPTRLRITLRRGADDRWRFCTVQPSTAANAAASLL